MEKFLVIYIRWKTRHILFWNGQRSAAAVEKCAWKMHGDFRACNLSRTAFVRVLCSFIPFIQKMLRRKLGNVWNHFDHEREDKKILQTVHHLVCFLRLCCIIAQCLKIPQNITKHCERSEICPSFIFGAKIQIFDKMDILNDFQTLLFAQEFDKIKGKRYKILT